MSKTDAYNTKWSAGTKKRASTLTVAGREMRESVPEKAMSELSLE